MTTSNRASYLVLVVPALLSASGCATTGKSISAGVLAGALAGAGAGSMADPGKRGESRFRNIIIGTAIGSAVGAGAGWIADHAVREDRKEAYERGKRDGTVEATPSGGGSSGVSPKLIPPRTEARWVPDQVRGTTFIPGHFEYHILENARWERDQ